MLTTYTALKTIHVIAAAVWVGGGVMLLHLAANARRARGEPERLAGLVRSIAAVAPRTFIPASLVLIGTGFWMIANGDLDYDLWVVLALVGWGITFLTGNLLLEPSAKRAIKKIDEQGAAHPETLSSISRFLRAASIDQVVLVLVIVDMVIKPT